MDLKFNFYQIDFDNISNEQIEECDNVWINMWEVFIIRKDEEKFLYKILDKFKNIKQIIFVNYNNLDNHSHFEDILDGFSNVRMLEK
jgi:hypothetical protein